MPPKKNPNFEVEMDAKLKSLETVLLQAITSSESRITKRLDDMNDKIVELTEKVETLEEKHDTLRDDHDDLKKTVMEMKNQLDELKEYKKTQEKATITAKNQAVMMEYHSKKYNSILYNWPENKAWESPDDSRKELDKFLKNVLEIENVDAIMIANCHRLGTVQTNDDGGPPKPRPLIFRALFWKDRETIIEKSHRLLKQYNLKHKTRYGVSQQLPKRMQENKNSLINVFKDARKNKLKTKWKINYTDAIYYLSVDGKDVLPT